METQQSFDQLPPEEQEMLLKLPALVSVLAAGSDGEIDNKEKADAIRLAHLRTFTADPTLQFYYEAVEKRFSQQLDALILQYEPIDASKIEAIKEEISECSRILKKTNRRFARLLQHSLQTYARHVKRSHNNFLEYFLLPISLPGMDI